MGTETLTDTVDGDQLAMSDQDLFCLPCGLYLSSDKWNQMIGLAENQRKQV